MNVYPLKCRMSAAAGVTRVDVFDDIGEGGWFGGGLSAKDFASQLSGVRGALEVHINSAGGDVFDGITIGNSIRSHKGPVTTVVDGLAASIASVIAQAGQERVIQPGAMFMIHDAFGACQGNASDMAKMSADLDKVSDDIAGIYAGHSSRSAADWRAAMKEETWYTAEEAVSAGLADKVGDEPAQLPAGLDVAAAFTAVPGRIAARLREMPVAALPRDAARHEPMTGTHAHPHPAYGSQGGDAMHSHEHSHDGDASHSHSHAEPEPAGDAEDHVHSPDGHTHVSHTFSSEGQVVLEFTGNGNAMGEAFWAWMKENIRIKGAAGGSTSCNHPGQGCWDPDGDGDCDLTPEGDTDHDYWSADGKQKKDVPGKPMPASDALTEERVRAVLREEIAGLAAFLGAAVDNSDWDASKAWHNGTQADDPEAFYRGICAGEKTSGDPATQAHWALPYKYTPSSPPNAAGVRNALARLDQTQDLKDPEGSRKKLQGLMKQINPDYEPEDSAGDGPADKTEDDPSGTDLEQIRTAFSALKGAFA